MKKVDSFKGGASTVKVLIPGLSGLGEEQLDSELFNAADQPIALLRYTSPYLTN